MGEIYSVSQTCDNKRALAKFAKAGQIPNSVRTTHINRVQPFISKLKMASSKQLSLQTKFSELSTFHLPSLSPSSLSTSKGDFDLVSLSWTNYITVRRLDIHFPLKCLHLNIPLKIFFCVLLFKPSRKCYISIS